MIQNQKNRKIKPWNHIHRLQQHHQKKRIRLLDVNHMNQVLVGAKMKMVQATRARNQVDPWVYFVEQHVNFRSQEPTKNQHHLCLQKTLLLHQLPLSSPQVVNQQHNNPNEHHIHPNGNTDHNHLHTLLLYPRPRALQQFYQATTSAFLHHIFMILMDAIMRIPLYTAKWWWFKMVSLLCYVEEHLTKNMFCCSWCMSSSSTT